MAEYIEREEAISPILQEIDRLKTCTRGNKSALVSLEWAVEMIRRVPAAQTVPVVHAHWSKEMMYVTDGFGDRRFGFQCSRCKGIFNKTLFCGGCGAKMDEEEPHDR
ncbi:MAG: hypothetical protein J6A19_15515 [Oscillospiraceae bacterium]|nr:hypothetical protein [Oscillospiraceae bacterium]